MKIFTYMSMPWCLQPCEDRQCSWKQTYTVGHNCWIHRNSLTCVHVLMQIAHAYNAHKHKGSCRAHIAPVWKYKRPVFSVQHGNFSRHQSSYMASTNQNILCRLTSAIPMVPKRESVSAVTVAVWLVVQLVGGLSGWVADWFCFSRNSSQCCKAH